MTTVVPLGLPGKTTLTALDLPHELTFEEWESIGAGLQLLERGMLWWIGDWLNYGEERFGEKHAQVLDSKKYTQGTLANCKYVAKRFAPSSRYDGLSWSHHYAVAKLPPADRDVWLAKAEEESWTRAELRAHIDGKPEELPMPIEYGRIIDGRVMQPTAQLRWKYIQNEWRLQQMYRDENGLHEWADVLRSE